MKRIIPALVVALLASGGAYAQSLNIGPGGITVDPRSPRERAMDREIRREERDREFRREERARERDAYERRREWERRRDWRDGRRGGERCRTITTVEETRRGPVRRTTRVCD